MNLEDQLKTRVQHLGNLPSEHWDAHMLRGRLLKVPNCFMLLTFLIFRPAKFHCSDPGNSVETLDLVLMKKWHAHETVVSQVSFVEQVAQQF